MVTRPDMIKDVHESSGMPFSVLMSVYYKENPAFLDESLNSVFSQSLPPDDVVLVKDGPLTDGLEAVIEKYKTRYPALNVIPLTVNGGLGKALNEGLKHCKFDIVARMDSDDICKPDRFRKQIGFMRNHPEVDACSAWIDEFQINTDNIISTKKLPETSAEIYSYGKKRCPINHPVVVFRRGAVLNAGGYMHYPLFEDYYLWARMLVGGAKFHNLQESLLWFRTNPAMYKRRGGWKYAVTEIRLQFLFVGIGYIGFGTFIKNVFVRFLVRIMPNNVRSFFYKYFLRRK